jgi:hypothetical protein
MYRYPQPHPFVHPYYPESNDNESTDHPDLPASHGYGPPATLHPDERLTFPSQSWLPPYGQPLVSRPRLNERQHIIPLSSGQGWRYHEEQVPMPPANQRRGPQAKEQSLHLNQLRSVSPANTSGQSYGCGGPATNTIDLPRRTTEPRQTTLQPGQSIASSLYYHNGHPPIQPANGPLPNPAHTQNFRSAQPQFQQIINPYSTSASPNAVPMTGYGFLDTHISRTKRSQPEAMRPSQYGMPMNLTSYAQSTPRAYHIQSISRNQGSLEQAAYAANSAMAEYTRALHTHLPTHDTGFSPASRPNAAPGLRFGAHRYNIRHNATGAASTTQPHVSNATADQSAQSSFSRQDTQASPPIPQHSSSLNTTSAPIPSSQASSVHLSTPEAIIFSNSRSEAALSQANAAQVDTSQTDPSPDDPPS